MPPLDFLIGLILGIISWDFMECNREPLNLLKFEGFLLRFVGAAALLGKFEKSTPPTPLTISLSLTQIMAFAYHVPAETSESTGENDKNDKKV